MILEANRHWQYTDTETMLIMPWYTLPMLEWLKKQDVRFWDVMEYGAGYSTLWWRANCDHLYSVDSDKLWARAVSVGYETKKEYYPNCDVSRQFDCAIVDGSFREACVERVIKFIKPAGFLIIDNWGQDDFPADACERTDNLLAGWSKQLFKQPNHSEWTTALFQKPA
jgi:hypothetical protein